MKSISIFDIAGASVFLVWLVLSVINQFKLKFNDKMRSLDRFHLVPRWTFFAPNPGTADYHLVYRDIDEAEKPCTEWLEVLLPIRSPLAVVWNPQKFARKVLVDCAQSLGVINRRTPERTALSLPYLALLRTAVTHAPPHERAYSRQFAIVQTYGDSAVAEPVMIFRSTAHPFVSTPEARVLLAEVGL